MTRSYVRIPAVIVICQLVGCAHFPENARLDSVATEAGYVEQAADDNRSDLLVALTLSGGGARAAAFAFGVLKALNDVEVNAVTNPDGMRYRLLDEVDLVSSVSGGSIVAGYWAAHGKESLFRNFHDDFLDRNVEQELRWRFLSPLNWFRLMGGTFERTDLIAEYLDDRLFNGITFDTITVQRPEFLINATDVSRGVRFDFTQQRFNQLCSYLGSYSLARAVAASSAVPAASSPITLRNFGQKACEFVEPEWVAAAIDNPSASPQQHRRAQAVRGYSDAANVEWVHLFDGGLADNLGIQALYESAFSRDRTCSKSDRQRIRRLRHLAIIVVDAVLQLDHEPDLKKTGPTLAQTLSAIVNIPIDRYSDQTIERLRPRLTQWLVECNGGDMPNVKLHTILVRIPAVEDPRTQRKLQQKTSLSLPADIARLLSDTGYRELKSNQALIELLDDLSEQDSPE